MTSVSNSVVTGPSADRTIAELLDKISSQVARRRDGGPRRTRLLNILSAPVGFRELCPHCNSWLMRRGPVVRR